MLLLCTTGAPLVVSEFLKGRLKCAQAQTRIRVGILTLMGEAVIIIYMRRITPLSLPILKNHFVSGLLVGRNSELKCAFLLVVYTCDKHTHTCWYLMENLGRYCTAGRWYGRHTHMPFPDFPLLSFPTSCECVQPFRSPLLLCEAEALSSQLTNVTAAEAVLTQGGIDSNSC